MQIKSELLRSYMLHEDNLVETCISLYDYSKFCKEGAKAFLVCITTNDESDLDVTDKEGWYDTLEEANMVYILMKEEYLNERNR